MNIDLKYMCLAVFIMALVTYIPRAVPIVFFKKEIKSRFIKSFLYYVPYAVLASLTFPAIFTTGGNLYAAIAGTAVALILAYFEKSLVVVAVFSVAAVFVTNLFL
jgi:branched-subunit amino acid transport protein